MRKYWVKCIILETGIIVHVTGEWKDTEAMSESLRNDGMIVLAYGQNP